MMWINDAYSLDERSDLNGKEIVFKYVANWPRQDPIRHLPLQLHLAHTLGNLGPPFREARHNESSLAVIYTMIIITQIYE